MENKDQILLLAKTAMLSKNYSQAFDYYSKLLENNVNDKIIWQGKGIAAGHLSTLDNPRIAESIAYIKASMEISEFTLEEKQNLAKDLINLANQKIKESMTFFDREVEKRFNEIQMGTYTLHPIHDMSKNSIKYEVGRQYRSEITAIFDLMELAYQISPTQDNIQNLLDKMNLIFIHSKNNRGYFGALNELSEENKKINKIWNDAKAKLLLVNPDARIQSNSPQVNNNSGCFIATAAAGDYNHPSVLQLRNFRDNHLQNTRIGALFIKYYYKHSPIIANYIKERNVLKWLVYHLFIKPLSNFTKFFN